MSVFSTSQPTVSSSHYWLTSGLPDLPSSAKKGSNWDQQRVHWYLIQDWPGLLPCPGLKHFNHALSQNSSSNWFFLDRKRQSTALFHLPLKPFWLSASVDIPRDAGKRSAAARNRVHFVQINVTVTIATIKTILSRILIDRYVWSKHKINRSNSNMVFKDIFSFFFSKHSKLGLADLFKLFILSFKAYRTNLILYTKTNC